MMNQRTAIIVSLNFFQSYVCTMNAMKKEGSIPKYWNDLSLKGTDDVQTENVITW